MKRFEVPESREAFDERAGILEFEAGLPRLAAEREALLQLAAAKARREAPLFAGRDAA
jgi:hypothetical protein